jgi:hypothetical protein
MLGRKRNEVWVKFRIIHYKEIYDLYRSPNIVRIVKYSRSRREKICGHQTENTYRTLMGQTLGKYSVGRTIRR